VTGWPEKIPVVGGPVFKVLGKPLNERELLHALEQAGVTKDHKGPILVVDDDTKHLKMMEKTLKASGYRAICKSDGESGLKMAMEEKPAAIVLDLLMPGLDGHAYLKRLRRKTKGQRIPVIVLTNKDLDNKERE